MNYPRQDIEKQNIERLAILNAWVTSAIVLLNLLTAFTLANVKIFSSLPPWFLSRELWEERPVTIDVCKKSINQWC